MQTSVYLSFTSIQPKAPPFEFNYFRMVMTTWLYYHQQSNTRRDAIGTSYNVVGHYGFQGNGQGRLVCPAKATRVDSNGNAEFLRDGLYHILAISLFCWIPIFRLLSV